MYEAKNVEYTMNKTWKKITKKWNYFDGDLRH